MSYENNGALRQNSEWYRGLATNVGLYSLFGTYSGLIMEYAGQPGIAYGTGLALGLTSLRAIAGPTTVINTAPTTARKAKTLAKTLGYDNFTAMVEDIPPNAKVADFGAGKSNLGESVTKLRDDVTWLNVDIRTGLFKHSQRKQRSTAPNLQYVIGDVLQPMIAEKSLDRIYSSWLLPHIRLESKDLAVQTVHGMAGLLKEDGEMRLMPSTNPVVNAEEYYASPTQIAEDIVENIDLGGRPSTIIQRMSNACRGAMFMDLLP